MLGQVLLVLFYIVPEVKPHESYVQNGDKQNEEHIKNYIDPLLHLVPALRLFPSEQVNSIDYHKPKKSLSDC